MPYMDISSLAGEDGEVQVTGNNLDPSSAAKECGSSNNSKSSDGDLNKVINMMASKQQDEDLINEILQDWKLLAQKVDYVLFWVFLFLTTISSSLFIFVLPFYNRGKLLWTILKIEMKLVQNYI